MAATIARQWFLWTLVVVGGRVAYLSGATTSTWRWCGS